MAGRKKQPLSVIKGKGKSNHLTKEEVKKREAAEEMAFASLEEIEAPAYLTAAQKKEFMRIAVQLEHLRIFNSLDVDNLARYLDSKDQYIRVIKALKKIKPTYEEEIAEGIKVTFANDDHAKLMRVKNQLFTECRQAAADLGLTIGARLKLVLPPEPEKEKSDFERKFGDV